MPKKFEFTRGLHSFIFSDFTIMYLFVILICFFSLNFALANQENLETPGTNGTQKPVQFYRNLFKVKRKEQIGALERILVMDNLEKQANMIDVMLKTIIKV